MLYCQYCKREIKNQGAKNLHERACEKNPANNTSEEKINKKEKKVKENEECEHTFVALNPRNQTHLRAIQAGYSIYCSKCKDLE